IRCAAMSSQFQAKACFSEKRKKSTLPIFVVSVADFDTWKESAPEEIKSWLSATGFRPRAGACALLPQGASAAGAVVSVSEPESPWEVAWLTKILPAGRYEVEPELTPVVGRALCLGWALTSFRFDRYKSKKITSKRSLVWPEGVNRQE